MNKFFMFLSLLLVPYMGLHAKITGCYSVFGFNPYSQQFYSGTIEIERDGETYQALWTFENGSQERGTGVRKDDQISFVFQGVEDSSSNSGVEGIGQPDFEDIGVQVYKIRCNVLKGPWAFLGGNLEGVEILRRIRCESDSSEEDVEG